MHAEFRINDRGIWPLEVAPRPIGGMCAASLAFSSAQYSEPIGLEELILRHAIGEDISTWQREHAASGVMMIPVPTSGIFDQVDGVEEARVTADVTDVQITARVHDEILAWPEGSSYLGFIFAKAESPAAAEHALREAHSKLHFQIHPTLPVEHPSHRKSPRPTRLTRMFVNLQILLHDFVEAAFRGGRLLPPHPIGLKLSQLISDHLPLSLRLRRHIPLRQLRALAKKELLQLFFHNFL